MLHRPGRPEARRADPQATTRSPVPRSIATRRDPVEDRIRWLPSAWTLPLQVVAAAMLGSSVAGAFLGSRAGVDPIVLGASFGPSGALGLVLLLEAVGRWPWVFFATMLTSLLPVENLSLLSTVVSYPAARLMGLIGFARVRLAVVLLVVWVARGPWACTRAPAAASTPR